MVPISRPSEQTECLRSVGDPKFRAFPAYTCRNCAYTVCLPCFCRRQRDIMSCQEGKAGESHRDSIPKEALCHVCNTSKGVLVLEHTPVIEWVCGGQVGEIWRRNTKGFHYLAIEQHNTYKAIRAQRETLRNVIYADFLHCGPPPSTSNMSRRAAYHHPDSSILEKCWRIGILNSNAENLSSISPNSHLLTPDNHAPHFARGAVCHEGSSFSFRVKNYGPAQSCVWCVVSSSKRNENRDKGGPGGRQATQTITVVARWEAPPSLPGIDDTVFTLEVPMALWESEHRIHQIALYRESELYRVDPSVIGGLSTSEEQFQHRPSLQRTSIALTKENHPTLFDVKSKEDAKDAFAMSPEEPQKVLTSTTTRGHSHVQVANGRDNKYSEATPRVLRRAIRNRRATEATLTRQEENTLKGRAEHIYGPLLVVSILHASPLERNILMGDYMTCGDKRPQRAENLMNHVDSQSNNKRFRSESDMKEAGASDGINRYMSDDSNAAANLLDQIKSRRVRLEKEIDDYNQPDISMAIDRILQRRHVAVCSYGSKIDFLRAVAFSSVFAHMPLHEVFCFNTSAAYQHNKHHVAETMQRREMLIEITKKMMSYTTSDSGAALLAHLNTSSKIDSNIKFSGNHQDNITAILQNIEREICSINHLAAIEAVYNGEHYGEHSKLFGTKTTKSSIISTNSNKSNLDRSMKVFLKSEPVVGSDEIIQPVVSVCGGSSEKKSTKVEGGHSSSPLQERAKDTPSLHLSINTPYEDNNLLNIIPTPTKQTRKITLESYLTADSAVSPAPRPPNSRGIQNMTDNFHDNSKLEESSFNIQKEKIEMGEVVPLSKLTKEAHLSFTSSSSSSSCSSSASDKSEENSTNSEDQKDLMKDNNNNVLAVHPTEEPKYDHQQAHITDDAAVPSLAASPAAVMQYSDSVRRVIEVYSQSQSLARGNNIGSHGNVVHSLSMTPEKRNLSKISLPRTLSQIPYFSMLDPPSKSKGWCQNISISYGGVSSMATSTTSNTPSLLSTIVAASNEEHRADPLLTATLMQLDGMIPSAPDQHKRQSLSLRRSIISSLPSTGVSGSGERCNWAIGDALRGLPSDVAQRFHNTYSYHNVARNAGKSKPFSHLLVLHGIDSLDADNLQLLTDLCRRCGSLLTILCSFDDPSWLSGGLNSLSSVVSSDNRSHSSGFGTKGMSGGGSLFSTSSINVATASAAMELSHVCKFAVVPIVTVKYAFMPFLQEASHISDTALIINSTRGGGGMATDAFSRDGLAFSFSAPATHGAPGSTYAISTRGAASAFTGSAGEVADTITRVLLSLPVNFRPILRHVLMFQEKVVFGGESQQERGRRKKRTQGRKHGDDEDKEEEDVDNIVPGAAGIELDFEIRSEKEKGCAAYMLDMSRVLEINCENLSVSSSMKNHAIHIHKLERYIMSQEPLVTSARIRAVIIEMTSNMVAQYDPGSHSVFIPQHRVVMKILADVERRRQMEEGKDK